ncbi:M23 family metallopeptidase [Microbacterium halotolerans]|uniref:M23 family metallopeptidase n=1 Tax=Microbacterium halotolerans TaxID=246613 RepID=UPI000E6AD0E2|nr:M23 family metallopeptidase [Microbacterium halotolerans]
MTTEQPTGRSVGDPDGDVATATSTPLTRRQLREAARAASSRAVAADAATTEVELDSERDPIVAEPVAEACEAAAQQGADAFEAAAKALNFTGETSVIVDRVQTRATAGRRNVSADAVRPGTRSRRIMTTAAASLSAMAAVGLLAIGLTTPLGAIVGAQENEPTAAALSSSDAESDEGEEIQAFVAAEGAQAPQLDRIDDYETASFADMAEVAGIDTAGAFFANDPTADIQWPFAAGTSMSYGYGMRSGRLHAGIDFTPGSGAPIQAIADGTVRVATESGGGYGVTVYIDHVVDGEVITSHYAHMQYGSLRVTAGQKVEVGDVVGLTGDTGHSFGAHLHFELLRGEATFDPMPWLQEHAGTHFTDSESKPDDGDVDFASEDSESDTQ